MVDSSGTGCVEIVIVLVLTGFGFVRYGEKNKHLMQSRIALYQNGHLRWLL